MNEVTLSATDLGEVLGITARRVRQLAEEGIFSRAARGEFPLAANVQAYVAAAESRSQPAELLEERIRLTRAQARRVEIENSMAEGQKVNLDAQGIINSTMAAHLFLRIRPLGTWLFGELANHRVDGKTATIIAGKVNGWLVGARAEIEAEMQEAIERSRQRGYPVQHYEDLLGLLGRQVTAEPDEDR